MKKRLLLILILCIGIFSGVMLVSSGMKNSMVYYWTVSEFLEQKEKPDRGVRIGGKVMPGSIIREKGELKMEFLLEDIEKKDCALKVIYKGMIPDMFKEGVHIIVEGKLSPEGYFNATTLMTKCPSKYESR